jgi:hypothetical protein
MRASQLVVPAFLAEPDIHLGSKVAESRRRRLSLSSLPVPKRTEERIGGCLCCPVGHIGPDVHKKTIN